MREGGAGLYKREGYNLSPETLAAIKAADATMKGPVGLPDVRGADGTEPGLLGGTLRIGLDVYANVRPVKLLPGIDAPIKAKAGDIDYVIVRENTEGMYLSRGKGVGTDQAMADTMLITRKGTERVCALRFRAGAQTPRRARRRRLARDLRRQGQRAGIVRLLPQGVRRSRGELPGRAG